MASPNSSLPPRTPEEQDGRYNPAEQAYRENMGAGFTSGGLGAAQSEAGNSTEAARQAEEASSVPTKDGFYRPSSGKKKVTGKGFFKRKTATISLVLSLLGGGGIIGMLFTPGLSIVQLKEVMMRDLNDQIAAVDMRTDAMWRSKLGNIQSGICTNNVQIRCKFQTMSAKQIDKFRNAGFTIEADGLRDGAFGRQRIVSMTAPNGEVINNPQDLFNQRRNPQVRSALNRVFNPLYASMSDTIASWAIKERFKTSKAAKLQGATPEELDESMRVATAGEEVRGGSVQSENGRRYFLDEQGNRIWEDDARFNDLLAKYEESNGKFNDKVAGIAEGGKAVSGVLGGAVKGVSVLGAADSACTVYNTARAVAAAAKVTRSLQLAQYSMVFLNTADQIKAGTATPEQVEYLGNILTATDTNKQVVDELSTTSGATVDEQAGNGQLRNNPFYGKNAFDSPGYAVAAYNDAPTLTSRSQQYMVGGGLSGTLSSVTTDIANTLGGPEGIRNTCGVVQSWWVRGAGLVAGVVTAIGSFGTSTVISIGASMAVSFALPFLEAALADITAGKVVGKDTKGVDSGDAVFSGSAALMGGVAQARGLKPLTEAELQPYLAQTKNTQDQYVAQARYEAQSTPFAVMNEFSFLGSFVRSVNIPFTKAKSGAGGFLAAIPQVFNRSLAVITPSAQAQQAYNPERFNKCNDPGYSELNIKADVFCNVRYGMTPEDLSKDPLEVVDFMVTNGHISSSGEQSSALYQNFITNCAQRLSGWGETGKEGSNDWDTGKACMGTSGEIDANTLSYFRAYTIDKSISDAMDDEVNPPAATAETTGRPEGAVDKGRGWGLADNVDYSKTPCDPRTPDAGVYTNPTYKFTVRLCKVSFNTPNRSENGSDKVASVISTNLINMFEAAKGAGIELGLSDGMRLIGSSYTQHKYGTSLDLGNPRGGNTICFAGVPSVVTGWGSKANAERACRNIGGSQYQAYQWLNANASNYGFFNLEVEPWHWSTSGL